MDVDYHAAGVKVGELEVGQLRSSSAGRIEGYQDRAVKGSVRGLDQAGDLVAAPNHWQMNSLFRARHFLGAPGTFQKLDKEKP